MREGDAIPRAHLSGELDAEDVAPVRAASFNRWVLHVIPAARVAGVAVRKESFGEGGTPEIPGGGEEPQAVAEDRSTERATDVVLIEQRWRPRQADAAEVVVDVVGAEAVARSAVERLSVERIATGARHEVDARPSGFRFTE